MMMIPRSILLFLLLMWVGLEPGAAQQFVSDARAQPTLQTGPTYFCPPCSCDQDGKAFHEHGRCPACDMKLLEAGRFNNEEPVLSPDGSKIAFLSTRDDNVEIYLMAADGTDLQRLTHHENEDKHVSWSPDGSQILFTSYDKTTRTSNIYLINADGSEPRNLTRHASWNGLPVMSPDGQRIAFRTNRSGNWDVYVMHTDGSGVTRLTNHEAYDGAPQWSEDGTRIHFTSRRDGASASYSLAASGEGSPQRIESPPDGLLSPVGTHIVYAEPRDEENNADLFVRAVDGSGLVRLTETPGFHNTHPTWSPDGARIYFTSDRDGQREIYSVNADGSNLTRLTFNTP